MTTLALPKHLHYTPTTHPSPSQICPLRADNPYRSNPYRPDCPPLPGTTHLASSRADYPILAWPDLAEPFQPDYPFQAEPSRSKPPRPTRQPMPARVRSRPHLTTLRISNRRRLAR
jgi:hypothetical protein